MKQTFNDNELDHWLYRSAEQGQEPPAADGWDTPPAELWTKLQADLAGRRKKRRWFFVLWAMVLTGVLTLAFWSAPAFRKTEQSSTTTQSENRLASTQKQKILPPPVVQEAAPETEQTAVTKSKPHKQEVRTKTTPTIHPHPVRYKPAGSSAISWSPVTQNPEKTNAGTAAGPLAYVAPAPSPVDLPAKQAPDSPASVGHSNPPDGVPETQTDTPDLAAPGTSIAQTRVTREVTDPLKTLTIAGNELQLPLRRPDLPGPCLIRPVSQPPAKPAGFYAGIYSGSFFTSRIVSSGTPKLNGRESGAWTWQQGLSFGRHLGRHWSVESGLQRTTIRIDAVRQLNFKYAVNDEKFDPSRFLYHSAATDVMETSFGAVTMRMDIGREPSRPVTNLAIVRIILQTTEEVQYWRVPFVLRWSNTNAGPFAWSLAGGFALNFKPDYTVELHAARADRLGIRNVRAIRTKSAGLESFLPDIQLGGEFDYRLLPRVSFCLRPEIRYGLRSMYGQGPIRSKPVSCGLQLGLQWSLSD